MHKAWMLCAFFAYLMFVRLQSHEPWFVCYLCQVVYKLLTQLIQFVFFPWDVMYLIMGIYIYILCWNSCMIKLKEDSFIEVYSQETSNHSLILMNYMLFRLWNLAPHVAWVDGAGLCCSFSLNPNGQWAAISSVTQQKRICHSSFPSRFV